MTERKTEAKPTEMARPVSPGAFEEMERWMDEYLPRAWMRRWGWPSWGELTRPLERMAPRVDVVERDAKVIVRAELPGVRKDDLEVTVNEHAVTISASVRREETEEAGEHYRAEIAWCELSRTVGLSATVDTENGKAELRDGMLELRLPKTVESKRRRIEIN